MIDAYAHMGISRFGTLDEAIAFFDAKGIEKAVLSLGPQVPDYRAMFEATQKYPQRLRVIGIPFGDTKEKIHDFIQYQLDGGAQGIRMQPNETGAHPEILEQIGEKGRWIYATGPILDDTLAKTYLDWLNKYPESKIGAPHFLSPVPLPDGMTTVYALLEHPRFFAIFSRHGAMGSKEVYPHADYRPWIEQVAQYLSWDRICWGSEYPVFLWRNESPPLLFDWLRTLFPDIDEDTNAAFYQANAERIIFQDDAPEAQFIHMPEWVDAEFNRNRTIPMQPEFNLPSEIYSVLLSDYLQSKAFEQDRPIGDYIAGILENQYSKG